jgi:hypothetical protein
MTAIFQREPPSLTEAVWKQNFYAGVSRPLAVDGTNRLSFVRTSANISSLRRSHCPNQVFYSQYLHHPLHVVGQDVQAHLRSDAWQRLHREVRRAHPGL